MLIFLMYSFAVLGISLLLAAAILQFRLSYPSTDPNKLAHAMTSFNLKSPKRFITPDKSHIIALDEDSKKMAVGTYYPGKQDKATAALYTFEAILGSEIVENALTLTKVSKTSRITNSPVWLNPSMSAKAGTNGAAESVEEINELTLKIYLDSADTPVLSIPFLPEMSPAKKCDVQYSEAFSEAHHVHEMIREIVSA